MYTQALAFMNGSYPVHLLNWIYRVLPAYAYGRKPIHFFITFALMYMPRCRIVDGRGASRY